MEEAKGKKEMKGKTFHLHDASSPPPPLQEPREVGCKENARATKRLAFIFSLAAAVLLLSLLALVLTLTVFSPSNPTITLVSAKVDPGSPSFSFSASGRLLNITLDLDLLVRNPNRGAFEHESGTTEVYYRGGRVGVADVAAGRMAALGSEHVRCRVTVVARGFEGRLGSLLKDVVRGEVGFDAYSKIVGRISLPGFGRRNTVAVSSCHVVVGLTEMRVRRHQC